MSQSDQPSYMKLTGTTEPFQAGNSTAGVQGGAFRIHSQGRPIDLAAAYRCSRIAASSVSGLSIVAFRSTSFNRRAA